MCEDQRISSSVARAVIWVMSHSINKGNMSNPSRISLIVVMVLIVVAVVTRKDRILWQLLPMHIPTTLPIPMPYSSPYCCCSSSYHSSSQQQLRKHSPPLTAPYKMPQTKGHNLFMNVNSENSNSF